MTDTDAANEIVANEIVKGATRLYDLAQHTSESDPRMAIAQLLLAAGMLARAVGMSRKNFMAGARDAWMDDNGDNYV